MNYYNASGQMDLSDRIAIETGICIGESFKKIAKRLRRHPSTIAHEVKENRTFIKGNYPNGKDCRMARQCTVRNLCGCDEEACNTKCRLCRGVDCTKVCDRYVSVACHKFDSPPYVCNNCKDKKLCNKDKYIYSAKFADAAVTRRRSESRQGVRLSDEKKEELDELVTRLVKKGQPLTHIYAEHENEMPVCLRTLYNYIDEGALSIKNIDLRRKTGYKPRKKKYNDINGFHSMEYRQCRTYEDFEYAMKFKYSEDEVTEMDTVKGVRESGKRLLTMIFRKNNVGVCITLAGIAVIGYAGSLRARNMSEEEKKAAVKDFALTKGLAVALLAGVMSACFNLGLESGNEVLAKAREAGASDLFALNPVILLVTLGGFCTNAVYCIFQNVKNGTGKDYFSVSGGTLLNNVLFCALAGVLWYSQFFGLGMGKSYFSDSPVMLAFSWSILMSLNVIFSNVWGILLKEWKGVDRRTIVVLITGMCILILSLLYPNIV